MGLLGNLKSIIGTTTPASPVPTTPAVAPKKILVVEDDQYIREFYVELLKGSGYDVVFATNGEEGLQALQVHKPDLVLLDLMMPVMDGKTMLHRLRSLPEFKHLPVIILTNAGDEESMRQTQFYDNANGFLIKSNVQPEEVLSRIKALV